MACTMKLAKFNTLLACFAHLQHCISANTQVIKFFILRTALQVNCVYCWLGANEVIHGYHPCEWDRNSQTSSKRSRANKLKKVVHVIK